MTGRTFEDAAKTLFGGQAPARTQPAPSHHDSQSPPALAAVERLAATYPTEANPRAPVVPNDAALRLLGGDGESRDAWDAAICDEFGADVDRAVAAAARGLQRLPDLRESAATLGVSPGTFRALVAAGGGIARRARR